MLHVRTIVHLVTVIAKLIVGHKYCFRSVIMARVELLSDQGFRIDGRKPKELRQIRCKIGVFGQADGSAYLEQGNTKVLAAVYGPHEVRIWAIICGSNGNDDDCICSNVIVNLCFSK
jgi:hypothetical protein